MIGGERVLGLITARGGSKRLPGKNLARVSGKSLIAWTIEAANGSRFLDRVILSSDSDDIIAEALAYGCEVPFKRSASLAADDATSMDVVRNALLQCPGHDWVVLLQPTSPGRTAADIDGTIAVCVEKSAPAAVSVCLAQENPYWMYYLNPNHRLVPILSALDPTRFPRPPTTYLLNGAVYVANTEWLAHKGTFVTDETVAYEMPRARSIDIDLAEDLDAFRKTVE
jgi:N-acylneuraminate cytidylyltransferase